MNDNDHLRLAIYHLAEFIAEQGDDDPWGTGAFAFDILKRLDSLRDAICNGEV